MDPKPVFHKKDADKDRAELIEELEALRGHYDRLKAVVQRYERVADKKDLYHGLYDLEAERDGIETLRLELLEKQKAASFHGEELEVQKEEIRARLDELRAHEEAALLNEVRVENEARRRVADAVEVERKRLFGVLETLPVMVCLLTQDHHVAFANRAFRDRFGEANGHCYEYCCGLSEPCGFCESYTPLKTGMPHRWEFHGPDGSVIDAYDVPFTDVDGTPMVLEMDADITERKRAEEALRESEELLHLAQQVARVGAFEWDVRTGEDRWTPELEAMYGLPPGGFSGNVEMWRRLVHPEDRPEVLRRVNESMEKGDFEGEWRVVWPDGSVHWLYGRAFVFKDEHSKPLKQIGVNIDITERKRAEEELLAAKQQAELYLDLMGHDINNMHQVALGYLELARDMPPGEAQSSFLDKPVEVLQRSAQLIQNVRKLQRLRDGVFRAKDVDVGGVLADVQREFGAIPNKRVTLNLNGHEPCLVQANELLHDVFANLVSNAIKHTGDRTNIAIDLGVMKDNGAHYCRVSVEDDGPGVPDDLKANIFNRTLKGTNKARGMGLGLYLVKSLVESYGGRVWVEDRIKDDHTQGARFVVMLPAVEK